MEQTEASSMNENSEQPPQPAAETEAEQTQENQPQPQQPETSETQPAPATPVEEEKTTYLKAMPLRDLADLEKVKSDVPKRKQHHSQNHALSNKNHRSFSTPERTARFCGIHNGDSARLGEERIVFVPPKLESGENKPAQNERCCSA
jgi:hypothetical protein